MAVTGPGLDDAETEEGRHQGDALILQITTDKKSVVLSQVANQSSTSGRFTVRPPQSLLWTPTKDGDPGYPLIGDKFKFSDEPPGHNPYEFSQQVYLIMASMNQIGQPNNDSVSKFMQDVVGANMGFIFTNQAKLTDDGKMVTAMIRDMIKSVLRGVSDFTKYPDNVDDHGNHLSWYPDPSKPTADGGSMSSTSIPSSGSSTSSWASRATASPWTTTPPMSARAGRRNFSLPSSTPAV